MMIKKKLSLINKFSEVIHYDERYGLVVGTVTFVWVVTGFESCFNLFILSSCDSNWNYKSSWKKINVEIFAPLPDLKNIVRGNNLQSDASERFYLKALI